MVGSPTVTATRPSIPRLRPAPESQRSPGPGPLLRRLGARLALLPGRSSWLLWTSWLQLRARMRLWRFAPPLRLCLGSGAAPLRDWTNIDLGRAADLRLDLRRPLPLADGSARRIYSEHLIEHLDLDAGRALFRECRRILGDQGVLRVATPDLRQVTADYREDWQRQDWVHWPGHESFDSAARMINQAFAGWGHRFLYDEAELRRSLQAAGFSQIRRCQLGTSEHPDLVCLESRADSSLVLEAWGREGSQETRP